MTDQATIDLKALTLDTARGMMALCDAITYLRRATNKMPYPGMETLMHHLTRAAASVPEEMFAVMFASNSVGMEEVAQRLHHTVAPEFQAERQQVPA